MIAELARQSSERPPPSGSFIPYSAFSLSPSEFSHSHTPPFRSSWVRAHVLTEVPCVTPRASWVFVIWLCSPDRTKDGNIVATFHRVSASFHPCSSARCSSLQELGTSNQQLSTPGWPARPRRRKEISEVVLGSWLIGNRTDRRESWSDRPSR